MPSILIPRGTSRPNACVRRPSPQNDFAPANDAKHQKSLEDAQRHCLVLEKRNREVIDQANQHIVQYREQLESTRAQDQDVAIRIADIGSDAARNSLPPVDSVPPSGFSETETSGGGPC